jgi:hypothetical protein
VSTTSSRSLLPLQSTASMTLSRPRRGSFATVGSGRACLCPLQRLQPCYNTQSGTFKSRGICRGPACRSHDGGRWQVWRC